MVVDSMYLQDVLASYSNSKLRFQVAQVHYKRFRDKLPMPSAGSNSFGPSAGFDGGGEIMNGAGLGGATAKAAR